MSPSSLVSIDGNYLAPPLGEMSYGANATYPNTYGTAPNLITVEFNGTRAPLVYLSPRLINVVAPATLAGQKTAEVVVRRYGAISEAFRVAVTEVAPRLFRRSPAGATAGAPQVTAFRISAR